jgi:uncharacterized peroxidase-related enzyme
MAYIKVIQPEEAEGKLKQIYEDLVASRGKLAEVHKIQSLRPESITAHMNLYLEIMFSKSELNRAEREMMAVVVSNCNKCNYCIKHHAEALNAYWKDLEKLYKLKTDFKSCKLSERELALCEFAQHLTLFPSNEPNNSSAEKLKLAGFSDAAILDAALVVSYFNFVNRMVLSLGVTSNEDEVGGYKY